jgi:hypothetical protein
LAREAMTRDPEVLRHYLDTWRDRLDPDISWSLEQAYLRHSGRTDELASHLVAARGEFNNGGSGMLMPVAGLRGYGRLLQGARIAPQEAHDLSAAAARIGRLPSREWNIVLLEAQAALFSGDRKRAVDQAKLALALMTVERDALLGPQNMAEAATVLAWADEGEESVQIVRRVIDSGTSFLGWAMVRDPLLAVPLAGNPAFEALKREVDPPN